MVCIAAFIILTFMSVFVGFLSLFRRDIGLRWWKVFQKAWGCVWNKVRLQKCETNFKDDIKNSILKKVVIKKPKLVKPLSITIETISVLIVFITAWSIIEATKAGLSLWTFGTCNLSRPSACSFGSEACSIDQAEPKNILEATGRWFEEWGEIFASIPDRLHYWKAEDYLLDYPIYQDKKPNLPLALDIFDPGCSVCLQSYNKQLKSGFFERYNTVLLPFPILLPDGSEKYPNSTLISSYLYALAENHPEVATKAINRLFTEFNQDFINFQTVFTQNSNSTQAEELLQNWLSDFNLTQDQIIAISNKAHSPEIKQLHSKIQDLVRQKLATKNIPMMIYDGKKHIGLYKG